MKKKKKKSENPRQQPTKIQSASSRFILFTLFGPEYCEWIGTSIWVVCHFVPVLLLLLLSPFLASAYGNKKNDHKKTK